MDLPNVDDLRFFERIAGSTTLTEAAREWGVSTFAVSKRLTHLERRLGVRLVNRSTRRLGLTDEGARYAAGTARMLAQISDLEESLARQQRELRGKIAIHSTIGLGRAHIAPLLSEFANRHRQVRLELDLSHLPYHVGGSPFDLGIRVGRQRDSRLHARLLHTNRRILCAAPEYLEAHGAPQSLADIKNHNCIVIRENEADFAIWRFGTDGDEVPVRVEGAMTCNDGNVATNWCVAGHGLIMRSQWQVAPLVRDGSLVQVLPDIMTPSADIYAVYASDSYRPRRVSAAISHLQKGLAARLLLSETPRAAGSPP